MQLTTERFNTDLRREVDNCRELIMHALDINSLNACLNAPGGILETVMLDLLGRDEVTKRRTNELRVSAMAKEMSADCAVRIAQQLRVHVRKQLVWLQQKFYERALHTCDRALADLGRYDEASRLYLIRSDVANSITQLATRLSTLATAVLRARAELQLDDDRMGVTAEFERLVSERATAPRLSESMLEASQASPTLDMAAARRQAAAEARALTLPASEMGDGLARECSCCRVGSFARGCFNVGERLVCRTCFLRHRRTGVLR